MIKVIAKLFWIRHMTWLIHGRRFPRESSRRVFGTQYGIIPRCPDTRVLI